MNDKHQRRGLGRGLGSLIPTGPRPSSEVEPATSEGAGGTSTLTRPGSADWIGVPLPHDLPPDAAADPSRGSGQDLSQGPADHPDSSRGEGGSLTGQDDAHATDRLDDATRDRDTQDGPPPAGDATGDAVADHDGREWDAAAPDGMEGHAGAVDAPADDAAPRADVGPEVNGGPDIDAGPATSAGPAVDAGTGQDGDTDGRPALQPVAGAYFAELPVGSIRPNPRQPREVFDEEAMAELVHSVREVGLLQPVVVRAVADGGFELVMGERRWRACQEAGLTDVPAIVRETGDDDLLRDALLENLHRAQLNALEEAAAYQQLLEDFGCTHDELAARIGRSRPQISNTIRLLKLSPAVQRRVAAGVLSAGHARALLGVEDPAVQDRLAGRVVAEGISVRALEEIVTVGELGVDAGHTSRRPRPTAPGVDDLAARLSDLLETRVKVDLGRRKGRITVEFASLPDLQRIVGVIDPGHPHRTRATEAHHDD